MLSEKSVIWYMSYKSSISWQISALTYLSNKGAIRKTTDTCKNQQDPGNRHFYGGGSLQYLPVYRWIYSYKFRRLYERAFLLNSKIHRTWCEGIFQCGNRWAAPR